eukprot:TRINITY_DN8623_c0_g1_i1.p1 TRINITY_DN8623_c0_g1~~TRINITY_DN8623_c0_g1_i1.p1  ORF type:complete len:327 (-),score=41.97 TRINITY_DN8623_c0_g1_i1:225-1091(-)
MSPKIGCVATMPADPKARWEFDEPRFNTTMFTTAFDTTIDGQTRKVSVMVSFCSQVGLILGDALQDDQSSWMGWSYGELVEFDYNEIQPIVRPPSAVKQPVAAPSMDQDTEREFTQIYRFGDKGWPCRRPEGRIAYVHLWCDDDADATCLDIPGSNVAQCADNSTAPGTSPCICSVLLDLDNDPCTMTVNVLMHKCPDRSLIPLSPSAPSGQVGPTGGEVFGIIVLVLFLVAAATFIGGFAYNYTVKGLRGVEALPFYSFCSGGASEAEAYQPAPSVNASYGSTDQTA